MTWIDTTYWIVTHEDHLISLEAISVDDPSVVELLKDAKVIIVPVIEFSPCKECFHIESCMSSCWEQGRTGGPTEDQSKSMVSLCSLCYSHILEVLGEPRRIVSNQCPRQTFEISGQVCDECEVRRGSWEVN